MMDDFIEKSLNRLFAENKVFTSEVDFQFALAWKIKETFPSADVRLEYVPWKFKKEIRVDIVVLIDGNMIPIELKYKTKAFYGDEIFLKEQGAQDCGRYDFLYDIKRMENIIDSGAYNINRAYVIFLTNDHRYWEEPLNRKRITVDDEFRVHEGTIIEGVRAWKAEASAGTMKSRESPINLRGKYILEWNEYTPLTDCLFKYALVEVE